MKNIIFIWKDKSKSKLIGLKVLVGSLLTERTPWDTIDCLRGLYDHFLV